MAIGKSSVTVASNNGSSATISVTTSESPTTTKVGDLVVVIHGNDYYDLTNMPTPTATGSPTLTLIGSADAGSLQGHIKAYWYKANTAGAQTVSVTETGAAGEEKFLTAYVLTGADTTSPVDGTPASNFNNTTGATSQVCNAVTTTNTDSMVFECVQSGGGSFASSYTAPGGTTKDYDTNVGTGSCAGGTKQLSASGSTGTFTWTASGNTTFATLTFAIKTVVTGAAAPPSGPGPGRGAPGGLWVPQQFPQQPGAGPIRGTVTGVANGSVNITLPSALVPGDMLVAVASLKNTVGTATVGAPAGWSLLDGPIDMTGATGQAATYTKVATAADVGATQTWTVSTGQQCCVVVTAVMSASSTLRAHNLADNGVTASTAVACASATAQAGDVVLTIGGVRGSTTGGQPTFTGPYAFTVDGQVTAASGSAQNMAAFIADGRLYGATAETVAASVSSWSIAGQIVLQPGTASGPALYTKTLPVAVAATPAVVRRIGAVKTVAVSAVRTLTKQVRTTRTLAVAATPRLPRRVGKAVPVAVSATLSLSRRVGKRLARAGTATPLLLRRVAVTRVLAVVAVLVLHRRAGKQLSTAVAATPTLSPARTLRRLFAVAAGAAVALRRSVGIRRAVLVTAAPRLVRQVGWRLTVAVSGVPRLARRAGKTLAVATTAGVVLARRVGKLFGRTVTAGTVLAVRRVALKTLTVAVAAVPVLRRRVGKLLARAVVASPLLSRRIARSLGIAAAVTPVLARRVGHRMAVAVSTAVAMTVRRVALKVFAVAVGAAPRLVRRIGKPLARGVTAAPVVSRRVGKPLVVTAAVATRIVRRLGKRFTLAVAGAPLVVRTRVTLKMFAAAVSASPRLARRVGRRFATTVAVTSALRRRTGKGLSVSVSTAAAIRRRVGRLLAVPVAATVGLRRRIGRVLPVVAHATPVVVAGRLYRLALGVAARVAAAVTTQVVAGIPGLTFRVAAVVGKWLVGPVWGLWQVAAARAKWQVGEVEVPSQAAISTEYVRAPVAATSNGLPVDPTGSTVQMAFLFTTTSPGSGDWKTASWDSANGRYYAQALVGPSGGVITLTKGTWYVWVRIEASPEDVIHQASTIQIT